MRIIWIAMLLSIGGYFVLTIINKGSEDRAPNQTISLTLLGIGVAATLISFLVKNKLLSRAIEQQQVLMVQQAYVVAWAITEVGALLGLLDYFMTGNRYYYVPLIIAACGQLLHFPRREHVINAAFRNTL
jgi:hypothetical protein